MIKKEGEKTKRKSYRKGNTGNLNLLLIENFTDMQKSLINLAERFDNLANQMEKLLGLFEISAKSFIGRINTTVPDLEKDKEFLDKLDKLLDQNKVIAKGLTLMEGKLREKIYGQPQTNMPPQRVFKTESSGQGYFPSSLEKPRTKPLPSY